MFPRTIIVVELPEILEPQGKRTRVATFQQKIIREALKESLLTDWKRRAKNHFKLNAKHKYRHYERSEKTKQRKRRNGFTIPNLVKSGRLRNKMRSGDPKITTRGAIYNTNKSVTVTASMPFPQGMKQRRGQIGKVTIARMAEELARWTPAERAETARLFEKVYARKLEEALRRSPKIRKKIGR